MYIICFNSWPCSTDFPTVRLYHEAPSRSAMMSRSASTSDDHSSRKRQMTSLKGSGMGQGERVEIAGRALHANGPGRHI